MAMFLAILTLLLLSMAMLGIKLIFRGGKYSRVSSTLSHSHGEECEDLSCGSCSISDGCSNHRM